MLRYLTLPALALMAACTTAPAEVAAVPTLEKLWVAENFAAPESIARAPDGNYLVTNVGVGSGRAMDGDGFISKISPDGELIERYWGAKLNGPKGIVIADGKVYTADIDAVMVFDVDKGGLGEKIPVEGAAFLNDITEWQGDIYVSDSGTARIYRIRNGEASLWLEDEERLAGINGVLGDGDRMLVSTMTAGSLLSVTPEGAITAIATGMINGDGIGIVPGGGYLVSSWSGQIHYVGEDGAVTKLLDTEEEGIQQSDLTEFGDIVIVPNWEPGTVTAWKVVR